VNSGLALLATALSSLLFGLTFVLGAWPVAFACLVPLLLALQSSFRDRPVSDGWVCFGEVGLSGEVRPVHDGQERLRAAAGHGYRSALIPSANAPRGGIRGLEVHAVTTVSQALQAMSDA